MTTEVRGLAVTWTAATNADGYRVQWKSGAQTYNETDRQHVITDAATNYTIPSLDPDTNYTIRVTATRLHADDGRPSAEQTGRPLTTPPAKVTGLVLTREVRALGVTWSTATDADGYKVQWKSGEETYNETDRQRTVSDGATTSDTIPGLTPGTPYTVQVIATRDNAPDGMSSDQQTAIPKAEPPAQVTGVSVTLQVEALAVTWSVATDADGYKVQWKAPGEVYGSAREQRILGGQTTAYTIPGLDHTVTYSLQVIAMRDYSDDGVPSAEAMGRPRAPAPAAVTGVEVVPGVRQLAVTWNAVTDADGYRVQWKSGTQSFSTTERRQVVASGGTTSYTIPNLDEDTTYTLQVTATRDNAADGPASGPATGRPKTDPPGRSDFLGTNEADTSVELLFREAANADGYKVQWKPQGGEYHSTRERTVTPAELRRLGSSILSYTITGLRPGTTYTFRVVAVRDNADDSQPSVEHTRRTLGERPEGRTDVSVTPQVEALDVSWDPISGATRYRLQWKSGDQDYAGSRQQDFATATSYTITGLTGGTAYTLRVIVTLGGANEESLEVTASARLPAPGAVTSLILTPQVRGLHVSWTAAQNADGYKVQWRPSDGVYNETDRQSQVDGGAVTAATLSNLDPRVTYAVRVIATREFAADGTAAEATASPSATVPGQVTGLGAAARGTDTIVLTWTAPAEDGGADIEGYRIEVSPDGSDWTELEEDTGSVATGYEHGRLERGTTRHYRVAAINDVGPGPESLPASATTRAVENRAPEFADGAGTEREVAENTGAEEAIGAPVTATDPDDDALTYGLEGADAAAFSLDTDNGQIRTLAALDFETQESYAVTVTVDDLNGGTASIAVTILVADEEEPARRPAAPGVSAVEGEPQQLSVTWTAPDNAGRPDLESYDLRYRVGASGAFTDGPQNLTVTRATLEELEADTGYEVQVRATNADGDGAWSRSGSGVTGAEPNVAPVFEEGDAATRSVAENTVPGEAVGAPLTATDENEDALTYSLEETAEEALFSIDAESGQLLTLEGLDFEAAESHLVTARAADPHGGSAIIAVTVEVIDEEEPPAAPAEPAVTAVAGAVDSLTVSWTEPENTGPPIAGYALQYRVVGEEEFIPGPGDVTGTSTTLEGLSEDTAYEVQVQASNEEGSGPWSSSGVGSVGSSSNATPQFGEGVSAVRSVAENSAPGTAIGAPLTATDADAGDTLTYALEGTDGPSFAIDSQSGQLRTRALLDYEAAAVYTVTVRADDGKGSGRIVVTINVTDRTEPPLAPTPPAVAPLSGSAAGLTVSWTPPANQGRPAITSYDVQYRTGSRGDFAAGPREVTGTSATLDGLARDTSYEVQVRARNADGIGPWSPSGTWPPGDQGSADRTPPRVVRIDSAAEFPTNAVFTVRIEFSERVSGLTLNELEVSNGGAANLLGSGANYTVEVTPASDFEGTVTVTVPADVAQDGAGNGNLAHSAQFAVDTKAPTVQQTTLDAPVTEWTAPLEAGAETAGGLVQYPSNGADGVLATSGVSAGYSAEVRASSGRDTLTLSYAETLDKTSTPPATAFTVRVDAGVRAVATVTVRGQRVRLRLTEPVSRGQTVTLSYRAPLESSATPIRDLAGNVADDLSAESVTDAAAAQERESLHGRVNRELLPYAAAALQASTLDAIANRVHLAGSGTAATGAARASGDTPAGTAGTGTAEPWIVDDGKHRDVRALLRAGTFVLPLGARAPREGATGTLWGSGDYRDLAGSADSEVQWNGALMSLRMGADLHGHGLLGGVAVTWSQGRFDYRDRATGSQREPGEYQTDLLSVHPYAAWLAPGVGANLWMSAGYGWGEVRFGDESSGEQTGLLRLVNGAVGGSLRLLATDALIAGGSTQMRLKGEGSLARVELTENGPFEALALDTRRLRLLLEGSHAQSLPWGGLLTPTLDLGLRYDDGAGPQGEGLELGAKLSYADPRLGLTVQGHGRMLATHRSAHEEWGAGGMLRLELGGAGRGLWLSVAPSWGAAGGSAVGLWQRGVADQRAGAATAAGIEGRLDALAGYGLAAWGAHGLLTPYGGMTLADRVRDYRVGVRLEIDALALSMEGTRYESGADPAAHRAALRVGLQY